MIKGAFLGVGAFGEIARIVFVVEAGGAEIGVIRRLVEGDTFVTEGFQGIVAVGAGDRPRIDSLLAAGTFSHSFQ